ncbi:uncharacterized protein EV420DRAFT_748676 [Desarmillaria tabescens]|uniref:Uncharacterized protein n=1 Tax=Armillaria tabescens TaxID=1929756 RepID=A0AA39JWP6_ARMTA|nr:uncharacterized protein EV420DRAFT_748676 [Desarmillaria tabescens]KAK0450322.1 hypothetical protein EV420DRAFT_748676 [Desarmillaria tabescens]
MMKRSPTPAFQNPPPAKHPKLSFLSEDHLKALTERMLGTYFTLPAGSPFTREAIGLLCSFWGFLYMALGDINREFQAQLKAPADVDWAGLLDDQDSGLYEILDRLAKESALERNWEPLLTFPNLRSSRPTLLPPDIDPSVPALEQAHATEKSWYNGFQGRAMKALEVHVQHYLAEESHVHERYAPFTSVIQSSGMGKSRLVDEFSKTHFVIPINLRDTSNGFPPCDKAVYDYLNEVKTESDSFQRIYRFLVALFRHTEDIVKGEEINRYADESKTLAPAFRDYMTKGQSMSGPSNLRKTFYQEVVDAATKDTSTFGGDSKQSPKLGSDQLFYAYQCLQDTIYMDTGIVADGNWQPMEDRLTNMPKIYIMWDEAHCLTEPFDPQTGLQSKFSVLRRVLRMLRGKALFSFFLSTTGRTSQFLSARPVDPSARIYEGSLALIPPFTDLGFDHFMAGHHLGSADAETLTDVTKFKYIVRMGRPLWGGRYEHGNEQVRDNIITFAQMKLANELPSRLRDTALNTAQTFACLAQRLALDITSTSFVDSVQEQDLVQNHMRVCLKIGAGFVDLLTTSSSEPILAEASSLTTRDNKLFNMPSALKMVLEGFSINQGDRGELLVLALFTMARDAAIPPSNTWATELPVIPVLNLLSYLFNDVIFASISSALPSRIIKEHSPLCFKNAFANAKLSFNHVIKPHQWKVLNRHLLLGFIARAAAILCANNQPGVDIVFPYLYYDDKLCVWNVGFILVQVKNDPTYTNAPKANLFDLMDPFALGLFEKDQPTVPIIRMVFALAAPEASVTQVHYGQGTTNTGPVDDRFTSYDFWCAGISPTCLKPVVDTAQCTWNALLHASYGWKKIYDTNWNADGQACRRQQNPLAAMHEDHRNQFMDYKPKQPAKAQEPKRKQKGGEKGKKKEKQVSMELNKMDPDAKEYLKKLLVKFPNAC